MSQCGKVRPPRFAVAAVAPRVPVAAHRVPEITPSGTAVGPQPYRPRIDVWVESAGGDLRQWKRVVGDRHWRWAPRLPGDEGCGTCDAHGAVVAYGFQHPRLVGREGTPAGVAPLRVPVHDARVAADGVGHVADRADCRAPRRVWCAQPRLA